jgi:hypothetical protein
MSFSISDIMKSISKGEDTSTPSDKLNNPDLPTISNKFDDKIEIRDKAMSAFKLSSQPRNGGDFLLPRTTFNNNPRKDAFLMDGAIDPNVIRKRVNPDASIPSIEGGEYALYSLVPENNVSSDSIGLIQKANANYVNYKNRFFVEDKRLKPPSVPDTIKQVPASTVKPAPSPSGPTIINYNPVPQVPTPIKPKPSIPTIITPSTTIGGIQTPYDYSNSAGDYFSNPDMYGVPYIPSSTDPTSTKPPSYIYKPPSGSTRLPGSFKLNDPFGA